MCVVLCSHIVQRRWGNPGGASPALDAAPALAVASASAAALAFAAVSDFPARGLDYISSSYLVEPLAIIAHELFCCML